MTENAAQIKLKQGLVLLLDDFDFDQLSVSKICKEAGVHRSTFYAYYDNQYELLEDTKDYINDLFSREFDQLQSQLDAPKENDSLIDSYYLKPYLAYIKNHQRLYKIYLKHLVDFDAVDNDEHLLNTQFIQRYRENGVRNERQIRYMTTFYLAGLTAIIRDWVLAGCEDEIDFLIETIQTIIFKEHS